MQKFFLLTLGLIGGKLFKSKYRIGYVDNKMLIFYMDKDKIRLVNNYRYLSPRDIERTYFEFKPYKQSFKIQTEFGHICKDKYGLALKICKKKTNKNSYWNLVSKGERFIIHTGKYCLKRLSWLEKEEVADIEKTGVVDKNEYYRYMKIAYCNPLKEKDVTFFFYLEDKEDKIGSYESINESEHIDSTSSSLISESTAS